MKPLGSSIDAIMAIAPLDLQTARDGDYVSLKDAQGVLVLVIKGVGTDNDDPVISFQQASDVAGTGAKDLATIAEVFSKEAVDMTTLGVWTRETQTAGASFSPGDPAAQSQALYAFQIEADELDVDNGFDCVRVRIADTGVNAQLGAAVYLLYGLRYPGSPEKLPNSIVD